MTPTRHIFHETPGTLEAWCVERSWPKYRAKQVLEWLYAKAVIDPEQMTNLSKRERETLAQEFTFISGDERAHQVATDGTQKLLLQWRQRPASPDRKGGGSSLPVLNDADDPKRQTECVMIPTEDRKTACISSQIGCPVGCRFCASGLGGLDGNLTAGRIVEQVWRLGQLPGVERITNVVFMGMGEPLANFANVMHAVRTIAAPWGLGIGARKISISTVGLAPAIDHLTREMDLPVTLALSLHAPNDELRRQLIPWAQYSTIDELVDACHGYFKATGREITLEYILLREVNDRPEHALELAAIARRIRANVNLIRYNEVAGLPFSRPSSDDVHNFQAILRGHQVNAHIRASRGRDIAAACGQLRHEKALT
ncbi:MAG: 23S rRNA (adenine(2503)-C(2))-methyltransferase RlmN [Phycisphaerales bacterium]|nr:23S rRNA (adenine(2503)-C(2))-methyltransferase RlmN [Phycisphaerales bacterium]